MDLEASPSAQIRRVSFSDDPRCLLTKGWPTRKVGLFVQTTVSVGTLQTSRKMRPKKNIHLFKQLQTASNALRNSRSQSGPPSMPNRYVGYLVGWMVVKETAGDTRTMDGEPPNFPCDSISLFVWQMGFFTQQLLENWTLRFREFQVTAFLAARPWTGLEAQERGSIWCQT